jgi:hypothetical protein
MGFELNTTGKLFGLAVASWIGAKIFSKAVAPHDAAEPENPGMPESLHTALLEAAWAGDRPKFLSLLDDGGCPKDLSTRRKFWDYYRAGA